MAMADFQALSQIVHDKLLLILPTVATLLVLVLVQTLLTRNPLSNIPLVGQELDGDEKRRQAFLHRAKDLYLEAYTKFKDGTCSIAKLVTSQKRPVIIVAPKYLAELKKLPDDVLSFDHAIYESMHAKYTRLETDNDKSVTRTVRSNLTPALPRLSPFLSDEVQESFFLEFPPCADWTPVNINHKLLRIVAMASGRIFVGPEYCRDEAYLDTAINYTVELMAGRRAVEAMRPWMRPFLARRLPEIKTLEARLKQADVFLRPIIEERKQRQHLGADNNSKPDDMLQWLIDGQEKRGNADRVDNNEKVVRSQLGLSMAAIHTTTMTATNALYNLAAHPELAPELRQEIQDVLTEHDGVFSTTALQAMKKLDSFMKETLRFHPAAAASFQRKVMKDITLSNGQVIPAGMVIEVPSGPVSHDPDIFPEPEKFDAFRFYRMRQKAREMGQVEGAAQNQFVSVSQSSLTFGYGRHACPGRFLAANKIKMVLANALLLYDVRMVDGAKERYLNLNIGASCIPDPTKQLLFKRRADTYAGILNGHA